jgi:hypothetical protein
MFKKISINISPEISSLMAILPPGAFVAGGAVRSLYEKETPKDIDVFSDSLQTYHVTKTNLLSSGFTLVFENPMLARFAKSDLTLSCTLCKHADDRVSGICQTESSKWEELCSKHVWKKCGCTCKFASEPRMTVDVVRPRISQYLRTQGTPEEVITYFDFTVARAALLSDGNALVDVLFEDDLKTRTLRIQHVVCPIGSVRRVNKYLNKGYTISNKELIKLFIEYRSRDTGRLEQLLQADNLSEAELAELLATVYVD